MSDRDRDSRDEPRRGGRDDDRGRDRDREPQRGGRDRDDRDSRGGRDDSRGTSRFAYKPPSREDREARTSYDSDFDRLVKNGVKVWKPADGENRIRLLPATWPDAKHYGFDIYVHYNVGPDGGSYLDLDKMQGKPDPITEEYQRIRRLGDATDEELKKLRSGQRVGVYLIDRANEEEGVQFYAMSKTMDIEISTLTSSENELINPDDPDGGYDVLFKKTGKGLKTKYTGIAIARRSTPLGKDKWLDWAVDNPIPSMLQYFTYDEIDKVYGGSGAHREAERGESRGSRDDDRREERQERGGRDDAREDEAGGRDRPREDSRSRDRDDVGGRGGRDSGADRGGRGERERVVEPAHTFESIHGMTSKELDALCESMPELSKVKPQDAQSDAQLADWICDDLGLKKAEPRGRREPTSEPAADEAGDRVRRMREERDSGGRR